MTSLGSNFYLDRNLIFFDIPMNDTSLTSNWYPQHNNTEVSIMESIQRNIFNSSVNMCSNGVICGLIENGKYEVITDINWSNAMSSSIKLDILSSLKDLQYLRTLDLSSNKITGNLIDFSKFPSLISLKLANNSLDHEGFDSSLFPTNIQILNLGSNLLNGNIHDVRFTSKDLKVLNISDNLFTNISATSFNSLSNTNGSIILIQSIFNKEKKRTGLL